MIYHTAQGHQPCHSHRRCALWQATLGFAVWALMSEADYALAGLRPALGRLANAMVAVLGPELRLGSPTYKLCTSVIREMQVRRCQPHVPAEQWLSPSTSSSVLSSRAGHMSVLMAYPVQQQPRMELVFDALQLVMLALWWLTVCSCAAADGGVPDAGPAPGGRRRRRAGDGALRADAGAVRAARRARRAPPAVAAGHAHQPSAGAAPRRRRHPAPLRREVRRVDPRLTLLSSQCACLAFHAVSSDLRGSCVAVPHKRDRLKLWLQHPVPGVARTTKIFCSLPASALLMC